MKKNYEGELKIDPMWIADANLKKETKRSEFFPVDHGSWLTSHGDEVDNVDVGDDDATN